MKKYIKISFIAFNLIIFIGLFVILFLLIPYNNFDFVINISNPLYEPIEPTLVGIIIVIPLIFVIAIIMYLLPNKSENNE